MKIRWLEAANLFDPDRSLSPSDLRLAERVAEIIERVRTEGDAALYDLAAMYDGVDPDTFQLEVDEDEWKSSTRQLPAGWLRHLHKAEENISRFHRQTLPQDVRVPLEGGYLEQIWLPIERVGLYIPGGRAAYPSSLLMSASPARAAGVKDLTVCTPPQPDGTVSPLVLAACRLAGIKRIFKVGGAGAIAALALGTESITAVDKIAGPGNAYVNEAKRQLFGKVGIDCLAGPSEVVILTDGSANPKWVAADLVAQAEHGSGAWALLICPSAAIAHTIIAALDNHDGRNFHIDVTVIEEERQALELINHLAPEHVHIMTKHPQETALSVHNAGAVFIGDLSPVAAGDYAAGPSHVLPTGGSARFMSGLGVTDFMKRVNRVQLESADLVQLAPTVSALAEAEGLPGHAASALIRLQARKETRSE